MSPWPYRLFIIYIKLLAAVHREAATRDGQRGPAWWCDSHSASFLKVPCGSVPQLPQTTSVWWVQLYGATPHSFTVHSLIHCSIISLWKHLFNFISLYYYLFYITMYNRPELRDTITADIFSNMAAHRHKEIRFLVKWDEYISTWY